MLRLEHVCVRWSLGVFVWGGGGGCVCDAGCTTRERPTNGAPILPTNGALPVRHY